MVPTAIETITGLRQPMLYAMQAATDIPNAVLPPGRCPATLGATVATDMLWDDIDFPKSVGTLSIKAAFGGTEHYRVEGQTLAVSDATWLVLNEGQEYGSSIDPGRKTHTFCLFFRPGMAEDVLTTEVRDEDRLLDDPEGTIEGPVTFFEHLRHHDTIVTPQLMLIRRRLQEGTITPLWLREKASELIGRLLEEHRSTIGRIDLLPGQRRATRLERYRRLERGRAYIEAHYRDPITLDDIARAALLSPYHFLRLFREAFGRTPGQYLTERRIEEARRLLRQTDLPIGVICGDVGFESHGSFTTLFHRRVGLPPTLYRQQLPNVR